MTHFKLPAPRTGREASFRSDFLWSLAGNGIYSVAQWGMIVGLAKLASPASVGEYAFALAVTSPIVLFSTLQVRGVLMSDLRDTFSFWTYLRFRILTMLIALAAVGAVCLATRPGAEQALVILGVGTAQAFEFISDIYHGQMQRLDRMDRIARSLFAKGLLSLALFLVGFALSGSVLWAVFGLAMGRAIVLFTYEARLRAWWPAPPARGKWWTPEAWRKLLWTSLPLGIVGTLVSLNTNLPRYFIEGILSKRDLGIYSALASLISVGNLAIVALGQAAFVRLARSYQAADAHAFFGILYKLLALGGALGALAVMTALTAGNMILRILFRPEYAGHADLFAWIMVLGALTYGGSCLGYALTAATCYRPQIPLFGVTVAATVVASATLVPRMGLVGAALASVCGAAVQIAGSCFVLSRWMAKLNVSNPYAGPLAESAKAAS